MMKIPGRFRYVSRGLHARTALLTLTRGEGGQNLIGSEMFEGLGMIRTGELLAADEYYGVEQYFTRAFDFGFSRTAEESFQKWGREAILSDMVRAIRQFRPHIIVSVWSGDPRDGHGHHQACGILAKEAFFAAGDGNNSRNWPRKALHRGKSRSSTFGCPKLMSLPLPSIRGNISPSSVHPSRKSRLSVTVFIGVKGAVTAMLFLANMIHFFA